MRRPWHETWTGGLHLQFVSPPLIFRRDPIIFRVISQRMFYVTPFISIRFIMKLLPWGSIYVNSLSMARNVRGGANGSYPPRMSQMWVFHWFYKVLEMVFFYRDAPSETFVLQPLNGSMHVAPLLSRPRTLWRVQAWQAGPRSDWRYEWETGPRASVL